LLQEKMIIEELIIKSSFFILIKFYTRKVK